MTEFDYVTAKSMTSHDICQALSFYRQIDFQNEMVHTRVNTYESADIFNTSIFRSDEQVVSLLYEKILMRKPDSRGLEDTLQALNSGISALAVADTFVSSKEFMSFDSKTQMESILFRNLLGLRSYGDLNQIDYETFITILTHGSYVEYCILNTSEKKNGQFKKLLRKHWTTYNKSEIYADKLVSRLRIAFRTLIFPLVRRRILDSISAESLKLKIDFSFVVQALLR